MSLSIIVLAAGKGTRMLSTKPKVFHEVGNYPMLFHVLDVASSFKGSEINLVISDEILAFKESIKKKYKSLLFSTQNTQRGTADAVSSAFKNKAMKQSNITMVLYGDTPLISRRILKNAFDNFQKKKLDLCVISMKPESEQNNYGKLKFIKNKLVGIIEQSEIKNKDECSEICNSGMMIFKTNHLKNFLKSVSCKNKKKEFYLTDIVKIFNDKKLIVDHYSCSCEDSLGVNSMEELSTVNQKFQSRKRKQFLKNGVSIESPDTVFFSYDTKIGNEVVIQPNVYFGPAVTIKNKVTIRSFSYLDHVKINDHVTIGPFARIRDDVEIEQNTKIGNFVEIKKSKVKKDVKISHLSYIGDAIINKDTNIGAGAITCNYDGKKKNRTIIGENCFIGSNSSLVAPLNIKKGSIVGAGTVVNTDIPNETVVYRKSELIKKEKKK